MKQLINRVLFLIIFSSYEAMARMGMNSWDDDREPWENNSSFGIDDIFMLVWIAVSFLIVILLYNTIANFISEKIQIVFLLILPCILFYIANYFNSGALNLFASASVISSAVYFFAYIEK